MKNADQLPILACETRQSWEAWLNEHHTDSKGIWLKIAKKETGTASVSYAEALEGALCYGWIDGQKAAGPQPAGAGLLQHAQQRQPLRHPLPNPHGQKTRNPRRAHQQAHRHASQQAENTPVVASIQASTSLLDYP